ncbi:MAG TPA: rod shape-determining protein MreD [Solirubrobacteraceae bacterium]|nr:rod shape-determining protein MreD [Solirubrobacteraceae bacterium]
MGGDRVKLGLRLAVLALLSALVQFVLMSHVDIAGGAPDLVSLLVMSVALIMGSMSGAVFGFSLGLLVDVALLQTMGVTSLVLLAVGFWVGRARETQDLEGPLVPLVTGALATLATVLGFSLMQFLLGVDPPVGGALIRLVLATVVLNALLAVPVHALVRRVAGEGAAMAGRRRRGRTTGGLSPLSSSQTGPIVR